MRRRLRDWRPSLPHPADLEGAALAARRCDELAFCLADRLAGGDMDGAARMLRVLRRLAPNCADPIEVRADVFLEEMEHDAWMEYQLDLHRDREAS